MRVMNTLEKRRPLLLLSGMIIALSFTLAAFEWRTPYTKPIPPEPGVCLDCETEDLPITIRKKTATKKVVKLAKAKPNAKPVEIPIDPTELKENMDPVDAPDDFADIEEGDAPDETYELENPKPVEGWKLDAQPEYMTGIQQMNIDLKENTDEPHYCYEFDNGATVIVRFLVDVYGNVQDPMVVRSESRCFEAAAIEAVRKLGKFKPAVYRGKPVPAYLHQPFRFKLME